MGPYSATEVLVHSHDTKSFDCGSDAQTIWLQKYALQAQQSGTSRVYVVCRTGEKRVVGYYALAAGSVALEDAPARMTQGTGRYPIPVILLTRMGVNREEQRKGLGKALVKDALLRADGAAEQIGVRAVLVHAESAEAREFYMRVAEFEPSPTDPLHLCLLMKDLRAALITP